MGHGFLVYVYLHGFLCLFVFIFAVFVQDPSLLEGRVTLHQVKAGSIVARQGDQVRHHSKCISANYMGGNFINMDKDTYKMSYFRRGLMFLSTFKLAFASGEDLCCPKMLSK